MIRPLMILCLETKEEEEERIISYVFNAFGKGKYLWNLDRSSTSERKLSAVLAPNELVVAARGMSEIEEFVLSSDKMFLSNKSTNAKLLDVYLWIVRRTSCLDEIGGIKVKFRNDLKKTRVWARNQILKNSAISRICWEKVIYSQFIFDAEEWACMSA